MGFFEVVFDQTNEPGPEYDSHSIDQSTFCNDDAQQRRVRFNDIINGDFVVGYNYNSAGGFAAQTLKIISYSDDMYWREIATGTVTTPTGFVPSRLKRNSTNTILTYPYTINISELSDIGLEVNSLELICNESDKYEASRTRDIIYTITDSNGQEGPTERARFTNSQQ